jgi:GT2 family glycosyltransferase/glycosyltransferase involved in cell wall biosynthesis
LNLPAAVVDIIMPVYRGVSETLAAVDSVLQAPVKTPYELIVISDNPDDGEMQAALEGRLAAAGGFTLLRNERNVGFVRTVNRGMTLHRDRDVLLLNSDTLVAADWLDRLRAAAYANPLTGTATPFSNNATICSYPGFCRDNPILSGWTNAALDQLCRDLHAGRVVDIPTAVGFCMYIRRDCLEDTGLFDAETFGLGYGEENDFCMRAAHRGWKHVLAADVFVEHRGNVSFQAQAGPLVAANSAKLSAKHPHYDSLVHAFIAADPILPLRREMDLTRLSSHSDGDVVRSPVCLATNDLPGGTERHVQALARAAREQGQTVVVARYSKGNQVSLEVDGAPECCWNLLFRLPAEKQELRQGLDRLGVDRLFIHQIVDAPLEIFGLGLPYDIKVHDYGWICPQVTLQDLTREYCGEPAVSSCEACYETLGTHKDWTSLRHRSTSVREMRAQNLAVLGAAERVFFPSSDVQKRLLSYGKVREGIVQPHDNVQPVPRRWRRDQQQDERVRAAYIGSLGYAKGFDVFYQMALDAFKRDLPLDLIVIGSTAVSKPLEELGVRVLGPYEEEDVYGLIEEVKPHFAVFPGPFPESFSYTLSIAFAAGLYPMAFDIGTIADRIRAAGFGRLFPLGTHVSMINDAMIAEA